MARRVNLLHGGKRRKVRRELKESSIPPLHTHTRTRAHTVQSGRKQLNVSFLETIGGGPDARTGEEEEEHVRRKTGWKRPSPVGFAGVKWRGSRTGQIYERYTSNGQRATFTPAAITRHYRD